MPTRNQSLGPNQEAIFFSIGEPTYGRALPNHCALYIKPFEDPKYRGDNRPGAEARILPFAIGSQGFVLGSFVDHPKLPLITFEIAL